MSLFCREQPIPHVFTTEYERQLRRRREEGPDGAERRQGTRGALRVCVGCSVSVRRTRKRSSCSATSSTTSQATRPAGTGRSPTTSTPPPSRTTWLTSPPPTISSSTGGPVPAKTLTTATSRGGTCRRKLPPYASLPVSCHVTG